MSEKTRVISVAGGALGLGGLAAAVGLCCSVPWAVALLGVTGAIAMARLAFLIPYALIGSAALLALGFWWAYRRPAVCVGGGPAPASRRALRWLIWITTAFVATLAVFALRFR